MSFREYDSFIRASKVVTGTRDAQMVATVGSKLSSAVNKFLTENGYADKVKNFAWEYHLVQNNEANAWCMPGGKIAFYTGIMPICEDESGTAVVMGHEIAHAVAQHGDERMSQQLAAQLGGAVVDIATSGQTAGVRQIFGAAYGLGATYGVLLPFSRKQESESDKLGMIFMAMAGYDPHKALDFWTRMKAQAGSSPPEFLSTHPSNETRIKNINAFMAKAMEYYTPAR